MQINLSLIRKEKGALILKQVDAFIRWIQSINSLYSSSIFIKLLSAYSTAKVLRNKMFQNEKDAKKWERNGWTSPKLRDRMINEIINEIISKLRMITPFLYASRIIIDIMQIHWQYMYHNEQYILNVIIIFVYYVYVLCIPVSSYFSQLQSN